MRLHLIHALLIAGLLTACQGPTTPVPTRGPFTVSAMPTAEARLLVEGEFTLPASLVSVGSGSLVSVGSGNLVSVGTGNVVSAGSGNYRVQSVPGDVPVANAVVALLPTRGLGLGVSTAQAATDTMGHYRLMGAATAGIYVVDATQNGHHYRSLAAVRDGDVAQAAIDVATTMVTCRLLKEKNGAGLDVLPTQRFAETVAAVRAAIALFGLPDGFTAETADQALAVLAQQDPAVARAVSDLEADQARLENRYSELTFQVQSLAAELGLPPAAVAAQVRAVLSEDPKATDEDVTRKVRTSTSKPAPTASTAPNAPTPAATTPSEAPVATPTTAPASAAPVPSTEPSNQGQGNGVSKDPAPAATPTPKPGKGQGNNGNGNGNQASPAPVPSPSTAPSATPSPAPTATPSASPTAAPTTAPSPTPSPSTGNQGNGNANGHANGNHGGQGGNGTPDEHANDNATGNTGNANGNNGNANGHSKGDKDTL